MFGKKPRLNPLASRKQLLIAESELNRAQLAEDWQAVAGEISSLTARAKSFGTLASAAAVLVTSLIAVSYTHLAAADRLGETPHSTRPPYVLGSRYEHPIVSTN